MAKGLKACERVIVRNQKSVGPWAGKHGVITPGEYSYAGGHRIVFDGDEGRPIYLSSINLRRENEVKA